MKKWEYLLIGASPKRIEEYEELKERLDELGGKGWEVCVYIPGIDGWRGTIILKREKE